MFQTKTQEMSKVVASFDIGFWLILQCGYVLPLVLHYIRNSSIVRGNVMSKIRDNEMSEAIQNEHLADVAFASAHFIDGSCYPIVREELCQAHDNLPRLSGFCFIVINWMDGQMKIIKRHEAN